MKISTQIELLELRQHEERTSANVRIGSYHMDTYCPTEEFKFYKALLEESDTHRLKYLPIGGFLALTKNKSSMILDTLETAAKDVRVQSFLNDPDFNLINYEKLAPFLVGTDLNTGTLMVIDGNHRVFAQKLKHNTFEGVPVYVCIHPKIDTWNMNKPAPNNSGENG